MGRTRITLVAAVLGGAAWVSGFGSAVNASPPCAEVANVNSVIQKGAHQAGAELRKLPIQAGLDNTGGVLSGALNPLHKHVNEVCNSILP